MLIKAQRAEVDAGRAGRGDGVDVLHEALADHQRNGPRTDYRAPKVRYLQAADCEAASGTSGFSVNVFRTFHALGSGKVLRKEKFHTDYIAGDTVRCGAPPKPKPERKPSAN